MYTCQNARLLEISCTGSNNNRRHKHSETPRVQKLAIKPSVMSVNKPHCLRCNVKKFPISPCQLFCQLFKPKYPALRLPPSIIIVMVARYGHSLFLPSTEALLTLHPAVIDILVSFWIFTKLHCAHDVTRVLT